MKLKRKYQYSVDKMRSLTEQQKAKCVLWMHSFKSPIAVQRKFRTFYKTKFTPDTKSIRRWYANFEKDGHLKGQKRGKKPLIHAALHKDEDTF